jgi:hypothetical protein
VCDTLSPCINGRIQKDKTKIKGNQIKGKQGNQIKGKQGNQVMTKEKGLFNLTHFNFLQFTGCTKGKEFRK